MEEYRAKTHAVAAESTDRSNVAYTFWSTHGTFIQPWDNLHPRETVLRKCNSAESIYAPDNL